MQNLHTWPLKLIPETLDCEAETDLLRRLTSQPAVLPKAGPSILRPVSGSSLYHMLVRLDHAILRASPGPVRGELINVKGRYLDIRLDSHRRRAGLASGFGQRIACPVPTSCVSCPSSECINTQVSQKSVEGSRLSCKSYVLYLHGQIVVGCV